MIENIAALADIVRYNNFELRFPLLSLNIIIWGMYAGVLVACLVGIYCKKYEGEAVRRLLKREAHTEESALTLSELGLAPTALRMHALRSGVARKYIRAAGEAEAVEAAAVESPAEGADAEALDAAKETEAESAPLLAVNLPSDLKSARLYIPRELADKAYFRYEEKGTGMGVFFAVAVAFLVLAVLLTVFIPELTQMLDNLISYVK